MRFDQNFPVQPNPEMKNLKKIRKNLKKLLFPKKMKKKKKKKTKQKRYSLVFAN